MTKTPLTFNRIKVPVSYTGPKVLGTIDQANESYQITLSSGYPIDLVDQLKGLIEFLEDNKEEAENTTKQIPLFTPEKEDGKRN